MKKLLLFCIILTFVASALAADAPNKLAPEDIVAKHLASIGTAEARAATKSCAAQGPVHTEVIVGKNRQADGTAVLVSNGQQLFMALQFGSGLTADEKFIFDGKTVQIAKPVPTSRTQMGEFFYVHDVLLQDGLLGGSMLTSWPLLDLSSRKAKLKYEGLKQVDGRELHDVIYIPKKNDSELHIHLYFDPETFRHVKTVYTYQADRSLSHNQLQHGSDSRYRIEENFSEFKTIDGVTLPTHWNLRYTEEGTSALSQSYDVTFGRIAHNNVTD